LQHSGVSSWFGMVMGVSRSRLHILRKDEKM
jgi:hypothetical protein